MAEINQGVKYTIEAEDKASEKLAAAGKAGETAFKPLEPIIAALHGNFEQAAQGILKMVAGMKSFGMSVTTFALLAAAVGAAIKAVKTLVACFHDAKQAVKDIRFDNASASLVSLRKEQETYNTILAQSRTKVSDMKEMRDAETNAIREMTKAQLEYNKALDIAAAKTEEERASIEKSYAAKSLAADRKAQGSLMANSIDEAESNIRLLEDELAQAEDAVKTWRGQAKGARRQAARSVQDYTNLSGFGKFWQGLKETIGLDNSYDEHTAEWNGVGQQAADEEAKATVRVNELKQALEKARNTRDILAVKQNTESFANATEDNAKSDAAYAETIRQRRALYEEWQASGGAGTMETFAREKEEAALKKIEERQEKFREYLREMGEEAPEIVSGKAFDEFCQRLDAAEEELKKKREETIESAAETEIQAAKDVKASKLADVQELAAAESAARARLAAAQSKVREAWGWYRDKDSMKRQMDEEQANAAAEKQFEKEFARLSFRSDWRTAKNLTVDQEAVRRVGLAREEEASAQKAVTETAANTARAAEELERIRATLTEEC